MTSPSSSHFKTALLLGTVALGALAFACSSGTKRNDGSTSTAPTFGSVDGGGDDGGGDVAASSPDLGVFDIGTGWDGDTAPATCPSCGPDPKAVYACDGSVLKTCGDGEACAAGACVPACDAAKVNRSSIGCDYFATATAAEGPAFGGCFVAFVANTSDRPAQISATFAGKTIDVGAYARIPRGSGPKLTYDTFDASKGLPPNEVAILFLAQDLTPHGPEKPEGIPCPITPAITTGAYHDMPLAGETTYQVVNTARTNAFHIQTTSPVVAYQMLPYGGAGSRVTGASLLLPTSAWDVNYVAA